MDFGSGKINTTHLLTLQHLRGLRGAASRTPPPPDRQLAAPCGGECAPAWLVRSPRVFGSANGSTGSWLPNSVGDLFPAATADPSALAPQPPVPAPLARLSTGPLALPWADRWAAGKGPGVWALRSAGIRIRT